jgi:hypothetical protein
VLEKLVFRLLPWRLLRLHGRGRRLRPWQKGGTRCAAVRHPRAIAPARAAIPTAALLLLLLRAQQPCAGGGGGRHYGQNLGRGAGGQPQPLRALHLCH